MIYWEYRQSRTQQPQAVQWGGPEAETEVAEEAGPPRLVAALAALHARLGLLPWPRLLQPAINLARYGHALPSLHLHRVKRCIHHVTAKHSVSLVENWRRTPSSRNPFVDVHT
jgi:gamma-glutamyltranspeptidase